MDGKPTRVYGWLQKLHPEFLAITAQLQPLRSTGVYHAGMLPPGAEPLPADGPLTFDPPIAAAEFKPGERVQGALLGCFGRAGSGVGLIRPTHALVVNLDYLRDAHYVLRGPGTLERFDPATRQWSPAGTRARLDLPPGGGVLVRWKR